MLDNNSDDLSGTEQNLSDSIGNTQRTYLPMDNSKFIPKLVENKTNAFDPGMNTIGIKNSCTIYQNGYNSNDDSENESSCIQLPPIIGNTKINPVHGVSKRNWKEKGGMYKNEYPHKKWKQQNKFCEDLIKVDKATIFKRTFLGIRKNNRKY